MILVWLGVCRIPLIKLALNVPVVMVPVQLSVTTVPIAVMLG